MRCRANFRAEQIKLRLYDSRMSKVGMCWGGSRVVQLICRNPSHFFQTLFLSSLLLFTKSIILLVLLFIMK